VSQDGILEQERVVKDDCTEPVLFDGLGDI
jgi:hypothetical protein